MKIESVGTIPIDDITIGMRAEISKIVTDADITKFADVSEDRNPIHMDEDAGKASIFKQRIAHGMLSASLFSGLLGERLPGHGTIYLAQSVKFLAPVPLGSEVIASVEVRKVDVDRKRVVLDCEARVGETIVITGEATVLAPSKR